MFQTMMEGIKEESVRLLFNAEVQVGGQDDDVPAAPAPAPAPAPAVFRPAEPQPPGGAGAVSGHDGLVAEMRAASAAGPALAPPGRDAPPAGPQQVPPPVFVKGLEPRRPTGGLRYSAPSVDGGSGPVTTTVETPGGPVREAASPASAGTARPARNAPCPCGSGRKYKRCHGDPARRSTA
jgi:preprotein translocase subunit SecA